MMSSTINLPDKYEEIRRTFFKNFDRNQKWKVKYSNKIPGQGFCDRKNKIFFIKRIKNDVEFRLTLIHEICHAVTQDHHGLVWQKRMMKTALTAKEMGQEVIYREFKNEIERYRYREKTPVQVIYHSIEDCITENPQLSYRKIIKIVAEYFDYFPEEFTQRFKRSRRVFNEVLNQLRKN